MTGLDLRMTGDVGSVRSTAHGLSALGGAIDEAGAGFGRAATESDSLWSGAAGDAFRARITPAGRAAREAARAATRMSAALHVFADRMAAARATIARARSVATSAGLRVSGETVLPPSTPPPAPVGCFTPAAAGALAHQQATEQAHYQRQVRAYAEAERLLTDARGTERTAHRDVGKAAETEGGVLADLNKNKWWLAAGQSAGAVGAGLEGRAAWLRQTQKLGLEYDRLRTAAASAGPAETAALHQEADRALGRTANAARATVGNARLGLGVAPRSALGRVLHVLPTAVAAAQGVVDVVNAHGTKGKVVAATADAAAYGAGNAALATGSSLLEGVAIGGAPETLGLSLLAGGAAYGTGLLVQHFGPAAYDWTSHAISNVADTLTHPARTLDSLAGDIGIHLDL